MGWQRPIFPYSMLNHMPLDRPLGNNQGGNEDEMTQGMHGL